jgi:predicted ABC-type ATPase
LEVGTIGIRNLKNQYFNKQKTFTAKRILSNMSEVNNLIDKAKEYGFKISLVYIRISSIVLPKKQIKQRLNNDGHNVEFKFIKDNLYPNTKNFENICLRADNIVLYDNSKTDEKYKKLIDIGDRKIHFQIKELLNLSKLFVKIINTKVIAAVLK